MKIRATIFFFVVIALVLASCAQSVSSPPSTPTLPPLPSATNTLSPTKTPTSVPTNTPTPLPSPTPTFTPSPTPDTRVILTTSKAFLCEKSDLPAKGSYILPNSGWISPHHNYEIIQQWGQEKGQRYLDETGRVDGWWVEYYRSSNNEVLPKYIFCNVIQHKTSEGAHISLTKYNEVAMHEPGYKVFPDSPQIGDEAIVFYKTYTSDAGVPSKILFLEFRYRNYVVRIAGDGSEQEVKLDTLIPVAKSVLKRLQEAELAPGPVP